MSDNHPSRPLAILVFACGLCCAPGAPAQDFFRQETAMSAESCQAALPVYDGNIRKRPLAIVNEGAGGAFVTCAFSQAGGRVTEGLRLHVVNNGTTFKAVSCTLVDGPQDNPGPRLHVVRALAVAPGGAPQAIAWLRSDPDLPSSGFVAPALSCLLEPGTGISMSERIYQERL